LGARGEAGAERQEKESDGEYERFNGRTRKNRHVELGGRRKSAPVVGRREGVGCGV
jgi:hypothetical protein